MYYKGFAHQEIWSLLALGRSEFKIDPINSILVIPMHYIMCAPFMVFNNIIRALECIVPMLHHTCKALLIKLTQVCLCSIKYTYSPCVVLTYNRNTSNVGELICKFRSHHYARQFYREYFDAVFFVHYI